MLNLLFQLIRFAVSGSTHPPSQTLTTAAPFFKR